MLQQFFRIGQCVREKLIGSLRCFSLTATRAVIIAVCCAVVSGQLSGCSFAGKLPPAPRLHNPSLAWHQAWSRWNLASTGGQYLALQPALVQGQLFFSSAKGQVTAVRASDGHTIWVNHTMTPITTGVGVGAAQVFVGTAAGNLLALSRQTGQRQWFQSLPASIIATPAVSGAYVFVKTQGGNLYAYQASHGHVVWNFPTGSPGLVLRLGGAPVPYKHQVLVGFANGQVASLDQQSGFPQWRKQLAQAAGATVVQRMVDISATPVLQGNTMYVASYRGKLAAINARNGHVIWQHPLSSFTGLVLDQRALYITDVSGRLWAFDRASGRVLWRQQQLMGRGPGAPALLNGHIVLGDAAGYVYAFAPASGRLEGMTWMTRAPILAAPRIYKDLAIVNAQNGRVKAYRLQMA